jgi:putative oxidoreductase
LTGVPLGPLTQGKNVNRQLAPHSVHNVRISLDRWAVIPLRLILGYGFMAHGYAKIARGPAYFFDTLHALRVPWPEVMGWTTILVELIGGLAVLIGALIPLVSVPLAAILLVAMITVHLPYGFSSIKLQSVTKDGPQFGKPGYETSLLYLAGLAALVVGGPGPFAVDGLLAHARRKRGPNDG